MKNKAWKNPNKELPTAPPNGFVSHMVIVSLTSGRKSIGQYDVSRNIWYATGKLEDERVNGWMEFPE